MINSVSECESSPNTRLKSANNLITNRKSIRNKIADEELFNDVHSHIQSSKNKNSHSKELKLSLKRIDETNYISAFSPRSLKTMKEILQNSKLPNTTFAIQSGKEENSQKSLRWSERNENKVMNLVEELINNSDSEDDLLNISKKRTRKTVDRFGELIDLNKIEISTTPKRSRKSSVSYITPTQSKNIENTLESVTLKRTRKPIDRFGESVDLSNINIMNSPPEYKRTRKSSVSYVTPNKSNNIENTLESVTPKRTRKPIDRFGESVDLSNINIMNSPPEYKRTRKSSVSYVTPNKSNNIENTLESVTPKRTRKPIERFGESVDSSNINIMNSLPEYKRTRKSSVSYATPNKSNNIENTLESVTPKRTRKPVDRFGETDSNEILHSNTSESGRTRKSSVSYTTPSKSKNMTNTLEFVTPKRSRKHVDRFGEEIDRNDESDFEIDNLKTPVNKRIRMSMTPTTRSGSKVRRSILQDIPENETVSTPKTPRKTPKAYVKNLTASASKRLDSGAKVPCSPLEKARASLHLHAAPKHLPCREVEFKSIYSFLARKVNDELTGSMYVSGVPGTGKTATVKRVIDALNADVIMKHSFKFIEINGLRLANPHQAFSVIWKELTAQTVSSSRAQSLLNDYFSGKEIRELSTILLVDEVDHICNRKQDVVYNILDWPSRTGSKVIVVTIANTMDLPERVLRGCVTSRMGLTRLVFKPYTFQQLQEIITNRLLGNSSFDPDAVQLVARKVAAVSGDARRALDICRRAIDLIKSEDDVQLITINHVTQVLNSILSGVRVTAIRHCTLLEQFFLKALRNETTRTGFDHSTIDSVYSQMKSICLLEGEELPNDQQVILMAYRLREFGLIFLEKKRSDIFRKVSLNVSPEDISYALDKYNN